MVDANMSPREGADLLKEQIDNGRRLLNGTQVSVAQEVAWSTTAEMVLRRVFGNNSNCMEGFKRAAPRPRVSDFQDEVKMGRHRHAVVLNRVKVLDALKENLEGDVRRQHSKEKEVMAKGKQPVSIPPSVSNAEGAELIRRQIDKGRAILANRPITSAVEQGWETVTQDYLVKVFGSDSHHIETVMSIGRYAFAMGGGNETEWEAQRAEDMTERLVVLEALVESLQPSSSHATPTTPEKAMRTDSVFVVHGRDNAMKLECARFVEKLGLKAIILHEQPTSGRTIIEKFLAHADVGFAIAILSADDVGGIAGGEQKPRARQNVVFELGYFIGKLGRERTCALYAKDVELPSDYHGMGFVAIDDAGAWKTELAREMKAAGLDVDMNKVA